MKKIRLVPITPLEALSVDNRALSIDINGETVVSFSANVDRLNEVVGWLFENTTHRFVLVGTDTVYFENDDEAAHFRLAWG